MLAYHSIEHMGLIALVLRLGAPSRLRPCCCTSSVTASPRQCSSSRPARFSSSKDRARSKRSPRSCHAVPCSWHLRFRPRRALGPPAIQSLRERAEHDPCRSRRRARLGAGISLVCMAVIFAVVMSHGRHLLLGQSSDSSSIMPTSRLVSVPLISGLVACACFVFSPGHSNRYSTPPHTSSGHERRHEETAFVGHDASITPR